MDIGFQALRVFRQVVLDGSFSEAARSLKITQPTVSQHISKLEETVGGKLFERVGKSIHMTDLGRDFQSFANDVLERGEIYSAQLNERRDLPSGLVRYAMPESCQWTPHYRKIMSQIRDFPGIRFEIDILPNEQITQLILEGKIDFGFVTGDRLNPELRFDKFADEHYSLVATDKNFFAALKTGRAEDLRLVSYPGWELFFSTWAKSFGLLVEMRKNLPQSTVRVGTLAGAIHAVQEGAGVAVIPTHCVSDELSDGRLFAYPQTKEKGPTNSIHIVRRGGEKLSRRAELVLDMLRAAKRELG